MLDALSAFGLWALGLAFSALLVLILAALLSAFLSGVIDGYNRRGRERGK